MLHEATLKRGAHVSLLFMFVFVFLAWQFQPAHTKDISLFSALDATVEKLNSSRTFTPNETTYHPYFEIALKLGKTKADPIEVMIQTKPDSPYASPFFLQATLVRDADDIFRVVHHRLKEKR